MYSCACAGTQDLQITITILYEPSYLATIVKFSPV